MTLAELLQSIDDVIFTNNVKAIEAVDHNALLKDIVLALYPEPGEGTSTGVANWTDEVDVLEGTYWFFDNRIWRADQNSGPEFDGPVEPGSDPAFWTEIPASELAHPQNTDYKLATTRRNITTAGEIDMFDGNFSDRNFLDLRLSEAGSVSIKTFQNGGMSLVSPIDHYIFVVVNQGFENVTFANDANQEIGETIVLSEGDWALFKGVGEKTQLLLSNVQQKWESDGTDTKLKTAEPIDMQGETLKGLPEATANGEAVRFDEFNNHSARHEKGGDDEIELKNLADVDPTSLAEYDIWGIAADEETTVNYKGVELSQAMQFVTTEVTSNRTLLLTDLYKTITVNSATVVTLTIPQNTLKKGDWINIYCKGAGGVLVEVEDDTEMHLNDEDQIFEGRWAQIVSLDDTTDDEVFNLIGGE